MYIPTTTLTQGGTGGLTDYPLAFSIDPRNLTDSSTGSFAANGARGHRVQIPRSGILMDMALFITIQSGNIDVGVYDCGTPRTRLWSTGSMASPAADAWRVVGDPNLSVVAGQMYDFVIAVDNSSVAFSRVVLATTNIAQLPSEYTFGQSGTPWIAWSASAQFPLPPTIAEGSIITNQAIHGMICRIA